MKATIPALPAGAVEVTMREIGRIIALGIPGPGRAEAEDWQFAQALELLGQVRNAGYDIVPRTAKPDEESLMTVEMQGAEQENPGRYHCGAHGEVIVRQRGDTTGIWLRRVEAFRAEHQDCRWTKTVGTDHGLVAQAIQDQAVAPEDLKRAIEHITTTEPGQRKTVVINDEQASGDWLDGIARQAKARWEAKLVTYSRLDDASSVLDKAVSAAEGLGSTRAAANATHAVRDAHVAIRRAMRLVEDLEV